MKILNLTEYVLRLVCLDWQVSHPITLWWWSQHSSSQAPPNLDFLSPNQLPRWLQAVTLHKCWILHLPCFHFTPLPQPGKLLYFPVCNASFLFWVWSPTWENSGDKICLRLNKAPAGPQKTFYNCFHRSGGLTVISKPIFMCKIEKCPFKFFLTLHRLNSHKNITDQ